MTPERIYPLPITAEQLAQEPAVRELLEAQNALPYHSYDTEPSRHVRRVMGAVTDLANAQQLSPEDTELLKIAALFHDIEYPEGARGHEERSADAARYFMEPFGFSEEQIYKVSDTIRATAGRFQDGTYVYDKTDNSMQQAIRDADFSHFGKGFDECKAVVDALRQELGAGDRKKWIEEQVVFMKGHEWQSEAARYLWELQKQLNIEEFERMLVENDY